MSAAPQPQPAEQQPKRPSEESAASGGPLPENDVKMTIWEHLAELRKRLIRSALALFACAAVCWTFRVKILEWLLKPYEHAWMARFPGPPELLTLSPGDAFLGYLQLAFVAGIVCAIPIIFYQLWSFVAPGLYKREKRLIVPFVLFSTILFLGGVAFAYYVAFPFTFNYFFSLLGTVTEHGTVLTQKPTLEFYLDFATRMLLAFGAVFELPLFISFLVLGGIVTPRQLLRFSRWAIVLAFVLGAVVTPGPEVTSQIAVSGALIGLYFLSLGIAWVLKPRPRKEEAEGAPPPGA
jgi:sec-independent protein translocase protein TatC